MLRALAWLDPETDPGLLCEWGGDLELMRETGQLHEPMSSPFVPRWDPQPRAEGRTPRVLDYGHIGEDVDGVWLKVHPVAALLEEPALWDVYAEARTLPEVTPADRERLSAFEFDCKVTFVAAHQRKARAPRPKADG